MKAIYFAVPPGTPPGQCRSCHAPVYWIVTGHGKRMPVDCEVDGAQRPGRDPGRGVSHFATCPHAAQHRKRGAK
jgi:hypothetical protein